MSTRRRTPFDYLVMLPVVSVLGCPCCGPEWYRKLFRLADDLAGRPYFPEYDNTKSAP